VIKLFSVERREDGFSLPLLTAYILFSLQLPFNWIDFFEKEGQRLLLGLALASKQALFFFCCLNLAIALQSAVLWLFLSQ
jgi:hypothetical protein